ncbi:MAG: hypothetical protein R2700_00535 [Solirubrobacterales bacterium]
MTGEEEFSLPELDIDAATTLAVTATREGSDPVEFEAQVRLDTANERQYYRHGGILHRVLRELR